MNVNKLKKKVIKKIKSTEEAAFDKFCEDEIENCLKRIEEAKKPYTEELMRFRNITEKSLKAAFNAYSIVRQTSIKDEYIEKIKGKK